MENINKVSFEQLYIRLYNENFQELEDLRKKDAKPVKKILFIVVAIFTYLTIFLISSVFWGIKVFQDNTVENMLGFAIFEMFGGFIFVILFVVAGIFIFKLAKKSSVVDKKGIIDENNIEPKKTYKSLFKEKIVTPIIKQVLPNSNYFFNEGITKEEYAKGDFEKFDTYDSEDKIVTKISIKDCKENECILIMSEVHTEDVRRDSEGRTEYTTLFHGLAGYIKLPKNINCYIKVMNNKERLLRNKKDNFQMDMTEFEKMFDVSTSDKIKTMQLLTADIMLEILELVNISKFNFEFHINNDTMYIRFHTGELFEPTVFSQALQFEYLKKYFDIVNSVKNITEHICNTIMNAEV